MYNDITQDLNFVREFTIDNILFSYIDNSNIHGFGLFASEEIVPKTILGILDGQVMQWDKYDALSHYLKNKMDEFQNYIFMEWNALDTETLLVRPFRTKYSYINHSYEPNIKIQYNPIRIEAIKKIQKDEELLLNYTNEPLRSDYMEGHGKTYL